MKKLAYLSIVIGLLLMGCKETKKSKEKPLLDSEPKYEMVETPPPAAVSPAADIMIVPIEHATAVLEWNNTTIYIDPVGGANAFKGQKQPDLILITD
ncbi:MAG: MBL fold metallo-hydrolase, partial [Maribacter sp.]|nr:MBL fold metallo-hydrolase [Maribacter sp.]